VYGVVKRQVNRATRIPYEPPQEGHLTKKSSFRPIGRRLSMAPIASADFLLSVVKPTSHAEIKSFLFLTLAP
jgi:hypothetical protein